MVRSSFSVLFFIRENRVRKNGTTIIEVLITVNGERCGFSTGKKVKATSWDKAKQQIKGKDKEAKSLNSFQCEARISWKESMSRRDAISLRIALTILKLIMGNDGFIMIPQNIW